MNYFEHHKKALLVILILVLVFVTLVGFKVGAGSRPGFYINCADAKAHHDTNIPNTSRFYRPQLDRNHNGIACQE